ncbi:MAG: hypothetical protein ACLR31_21515 [Escherichia coli]
MTPACRWQNVLVALHTLQGRHGACLQYRIHEGAPWHQRFGLERNQQLLAAAFPAMHRRQTGW